MQKNSKVPLYFQLIENIRTNIENETWAKDEKIPSERQLAKIYSVSRITVRKAIDELSRIGMLKKVHGKGTFVASKTIVQHLPNLYNFSEEMKKQNKISYTKIIKKEVILPNKYLSKKLNISKDEEVLHLERIRYDENKKPLMLENAYFPYEKYSFLLKEDLEDYSLYNMLKEKYNITFDNAIEKFKVVKLLSDEVKILDAKKGENDFGLLIRRTTYKDNNIEYYSSIVTLGDVFEFTIELEN